MPWSEQMFPWNAFRDIGLATTYHLHLLQGFSCVCRQRHLFRVELEEMYFSIGIMVRERRRQTIVSLGEIVKLLDLSDPATLQGKFPS
jgi:hypothetical protein